MQLVFLLYCVALLVPVVVAWRLLVRKPGVGRALLAVFGIAAGALFLAGCAAILSPGWGGSMFLILGLFAWGVFLHVPLTLAASAHALRQAHPRAAWLAGGTALAVFLVYVVAFWVEPRRLVVTNHEVFTDKVTRPHRIVLLADIQTDMTGAHERRALEAALAAEPDLILLAGDYVHELSDDEYWEEVEDLNALLRDVDLRAPLGVIAVEGNCDPEGWPRVFDGLEVHSFVESGSVERGELRVTGLSFADGFNSSLRLGREPGFHVVLSHGPDFALGSIDADLLLAGHTHGGQVQLPFFGPPITLSQVPRAWASGRTELDDGATLIVSRGIGMERGHAPRLRFLCAPQIVVIDVLPSSADELERN